MGGIFDRLASGAGRAAFEADKRRRIASVQGTIRALSKESREALYRIGGVALHLYQTSRIVQPELQEACEHAAKIEQQIAAHEQEIERIRTETYTQPTPAYGVGYGAGPGASQEAVCPNGHGPLPAGAGFCPTCGAQGVQPAPAVQAPTCQSCGATLIPGSRFCPGCGARIPEATPFRADAHPPREACANCGAALVPGAAFCPECGQSVAVAKPAVGSVPPRVSEQSLQPPPQRVAPGPSVAASTNLCSNCGTTLVPEAVFCPECGQPTGVSEAVSRPASLPVSEQPPPPPPSRDFPPAPPLVLPASVCSNCGATLVPEADFCPDCGQPVEHRETAAPVTETEGRAPPTHEEEVTPAPKMAEEGTRCPNCGAALAPEAVFCLDCGQLIEEEELAAEVPEPKAQGPPPAGEEETPSPPPETEVADRCPNCGTALVPEAVFCPECGQTVEHVPGSQSAFPVDEAPQIGDEDEASPEQPVAQCPNCGTELMPEAVFCPECGQPVGRNADAG